MAESYPALIKIATHKLEEKQRHIHNLQMEIQKIQQNRADLLGSVNEGYQVASANAADATLYSVAGNYALRAKQMRESLNVAEEFLAGKLAEEMAGLHGLFAEQKRYEKLQEAYEKRKKAVKDKKQQESLDETAALMWQRNMKG